MRFLFYCKKSAAAFAAADKHRSPRSGICALQFAVNDPPHRKPAADLICPRRFFCRPGAKRHLIQKNAYKRIRPARLFPYFRKIHEKTPPNY